MDRFQENLGKVMMLDQYPTDVLDLVISFLPVADVFRLRTVCKEWNEFVTARAFKENGQLRFRKLELLAICNGESSLNSSEFKAYDVETEKWHSFDLSFLPDFAVGLRVVDFSRGLACVMQKTGLERVLYVCNPLTKRWARLPSSPSSFNSTSSPPVIVRTYYCRKTGHYKVFVVSGSCVNPANLFWVYNRLIVEEFDSSSWTWAVHSQTCHAFRWSEVTGVGALSCNNGNGASLFIFLNKAPSPESSGCQFFALLFDEHKGGLVLVKIQAPLPRNLIKPTLVCCEQTPHPLLVSAVRDGHQASRVEIWELGDELTEWRNLAVMPSDLFTYFQSLHSKGLVERRISGGVLRRIMMAPGRRFNGVLPRPMMRVPSPTTVVVVAHKHLVYMHPESVVSWTIAYDTLTRSWLRLSTKLPPQIDAANFNPDVTASSSVQQRAFEPSLESVVSHMDMDAGLKDQVRSSSLPSATYYHQFSNF